MPMIACPECGLPREDDQVGVAPCPICALAPAVRGSRPSLDQAIDPTAGLPADVSELENRGAVLRQSSTSSVRFGWAVAFLLGIATGVGAVFAWQAAVRKPETTEVAQVVRLRAVLQPPLAGIAVAPMPHEPRPPESIPEPKPEPKPVAKAEPKVAAPARVDVLNQPDSDYTLPRLKNGEHLILLGQVRQFRVTGLDGGAILDATGLEAGSVVISGTIAGGSVLKVRAPESVVMVMAAVRGKSRVEINAPGGDVRFLSPSSPDQPWSSITSGSTVAILARAVDLRGDVDGADTKVTVTLTGNGSLKVAAVRDTAAVEYKTEDDKARATAEVVAPTATFKKTD